MERHFHQKYVSFVANAKDVSKESPVRYCLIIQTMVNERNIVSYLLCCLSLDIYKLR